MNLKHARAGGSAGGLGVLVLTMDLEDSRSPKSPAVRVLKNQLKSISPEEMKFIDFLIFEAKSLDFINNSSEILKIIEKPCLPLFCMTFRNSFYRVDLFIVEFCNRAFVIDFGKIQPLSVLSWSRLFLRTLTRATLRTSRNIDR